MLFPLIRRSRAAMRREARGGQYDVKVKGTHGTLAGWLVVSFAWSLPLLTVRRLVMPLPERGHLALQRGVNSKNFLHNETPDTK